MRCHPREMVRWWSRRSLRTGMAATWTVLRHSSAPDTTVRATTDATTDLGTTTDPATMEDTTGEMISPTPTPKMTGHKTWRMTGHKTWRMTGHKTWRIIIPGDFASTNLCFLQKGILCLQ